MQFALLRNWPDLCGIFVVVFLFCFVLFYLIFGEWEYGAVVCACVYVKHEY